ncbi:MAG: tRNA 2-thiocytidine biosynthesis TtcA family protein [Oscillospiraceae bacterium]|nr:tRNA 2-thiocytidine biosynthesis TtcA family protein [Oscillospiraceae bacterium]
MQKILSHVRRACQEFDLIKSGDKIAVGVSGGKDSLVLLSALAQMRQFRKDGVPLYDYELQGITLDPRFFGKDGDFSPVERFCAALDVPFTLIRTDLYEIVFDIRKEKNPCSLCAKMRRGALHDATVAAGCNKIALAHSFDDVIETFIMNLFREGRVGCFAPQSYLSRKDITLIRPLVLTPEHMVISAAAANNFEIVKSPCPIDKSTERARTKAFLAEREREDKGFKDRMFTALRKSGVDGWGFGS